MDFPSDLVSMQSKHAGTNAFVLRHSIETSTPQLVRGHIRARMSRGARLIEMVYVAHVLPAAFVQAERRSMESGRRTNASADAVIRPFGGKVAAYGGRGVVLRPVDSGDSCVADVPEGARGFTTRPRLLRHIARSLLFSHRRGSRQNWISSLLGARHL